MDKAGLWLRVSTGAQDEASQLPDLHHWCQQHGYEVTETYTVHGKSAFHGKHEADLDRAFADMETGRINVLVVWAADRIERRGALAALTLAERARKAGGRIEYVKDAHLNAVNDMSDVMLALSATLARQESKRKSERITAKHEALRDAGSVIGRPPWGYEIQAQAGRKVLVPTAEGRKYVPLIFQAVIDGKSLREIAAWLTAEGVQTSAGNRAWHEAFIGNRLIKNPTYYGQRPNAGTLETEALVSASTWQQANAALASRVRLGRGTIVREKALLTPICGICYGKPREGCADGISPMYRVYVGTGTNRKAYYRCAGHGPQRKGCGAPMVQCDALKSVVRRFIAADTSPHIERVFVPGDDKADEVVKLRERGAAAMRRGDYQAAMAAMRQAEQIEAMPRVEPHWRTAESGETEAAYFASLDTDAQREYLARWNVFVVSVKSGTRTRFRLRLESPYRYVDDGTLAVSGPTARKADVSESLAASLAAMRHNMA